LGPLGIILAFQTVIALVEKYAIENQSTAKSLQDFQNPIDENIAKLSLLKRVIEDNNISLEEKERIVKAAATEFDSLNGVLDGTEQGLTNASIAVDNLINSFKDLTYAKGVLEIAQDKMKQLIKISVDGLGIDGGAFHSVENFFRLFTASPAGVSLARAQNTIAIMDDLDSKSDELYKSLLKKTSDGKITFFELLFGTETKNKTSNKIFKQKYLDLTRIISGFQKREELNIERGEANKLKIKQRFEVKDLELRKKGFIQKELLRYQDFMNSNASDEQKALAKEKYEKSIEKARIDHLTALRQLNLTHSVETLKLEEEQAEKLIQLDFDLQDKRLGLTSKYTDISMIMASTAANNTLKAEISHEEKRLKLFKGSEFERTEAEKNLAMMRIKLQDEELEHDLMVIDMKMKAQLEYANFVSGIGNVFKTLGKENEGLAKVALVLEKGAAIAGVVVEAQAANQKILSASQTEVGFYNASAAATALLSPERSATFKLAAGAAQAGAAKRIAKNNIGAGIAIANILATTLTSRTAPSGGGSAGGGAGGGGGRTFDFNLVGSTGTNQLAEAVGGQFQEPIQAYVVSNEMTSQQELDLQIQTGASLGD